MSPDHSSAQVGLTAAATAGAAVVLTAKVRELLLAAAVMAFSPPITWGQQ